MAGMADLYNRGFRSRGVSGLRGGSRGPRSWDVPPGKVALLEVRRKRGLPGGFRGDGGRDGLGLLDPDPMRHPGRIELLGEVEKLGLALDLEHGLVHAIKRAWRRVGQHVRVIAMLGDHRDRGVATLRHERA